MKVGKSFTVRPATRRDSTEFVELLVALANYEHLEPPSSSAKRRIVDDVFTKKRINLFVSALNEERKKCVGYALYFYTYSSFLARPTLYLEDIFVLEDYRGLGIGRALFLKCADEARKERCGRMEWSVLTWNKSAISFYEKLGAKRLAEWYYYRLTSDVLERLSSEVRKRNKL
jgi:GNAT superfamily N-acetyltransferase